MRTQVEQLGRLCLGSAPESHTVEYEVSASAGLQSIKEDAAPLIPTQSDELFYDARLRV
jgi:hypothetical protein